MSVEPTPVAGYWDTPEKARLLIKLAWAPELMFKHTEIIEFLTEKGIQYHMDKDQSVRTGPDIKGHYLQ